MFRIGRKLWIAVACVLVLGAVSRRMQESQLEEPVPAKVVDPVISAFVYQGGTVVMRVTVEANGTVSGIGVVKPFPALTDPVVTAVRLWRFKPAILNGHAVSATTTVALHVALVRTVVPANVP